MNHAFIQCEANKQVLALSLLFSRPFIRLPNPMEDDLHSPSSPIYLVEVPEVSPRTENDCTRHNR
jgi:hypothetical protein